MSYAAELGPAAPRAAASRWVATPSGARLAFVGGAVVKLHRAGTDRGALEARLTAVARSALATVFVPPLSHRVAAAPDGSPVTAWPEVAVLDADSEIPWAEIGRLLARLHRLPVDPGLPDHGAVERLRRALERARGLAGLADRTLLVQLGERLLREAHEERRVRERAQRHTTSVVHGDFHLGQVGQWDGDWRLLDVDDLGVGDPAWDLGRPAGFWAAGLLADADWARCLDAYRDAHGPAVPATGDPWPAIDLPARAAVLVAAVRTLSRELDNEDTAGALLAACRRM